MKLLILNEKDMRKCIDSRGAIEADRIALSAYSNGETDIPLRVNSLVPDHSGNVLYMYGHVPEAKALGVKIVSVYPGNIEKGLPSVPASMILIDPETGIASAVMDGTYLTRVRTGAVSGLATELLSRENSEIFAMFGAGGQCPGQVDAVLTVRPKLKEVRIFDINYTRAKEVAADFPEKYKGKFPAKFMAVENSDNAVKDADIITTATVSLEPVFNGKLVKKGCHINAVGSYTPEMSEIDSFIVCNAEKIYTDTPDALAESGDLIKPINAGVFSADKITGELGALINGKIKGRESDDEITYFETVGSACLDLLAARKVYEEALAKGIGTFVEL